jgi:RND family efflux transporter MFP subunit
LTDDLNHAAAVEKRSLEEVKRAEADYEQAHLVLSRLVSVDKAQPHLVAQQDIDAARSKDQAAAASLAVAREQVEVSRSDVKKLATMLKYCRITAPFNGVITRRCADPGALVQGGAASTLPLVRLSENDRLRLSFQASVSFVSQIKIGDPIEIQTPSLKKTIHGAVSRFTRRIDFQTRTMEIEVDVPNPDLSLIPGMYASAIVRVDQKEHTLAVPVEAVFGQQHPAVFLIDQNGTIQERPITVGLETADKWEVLSGLQEHDQVLIGGRAQVRPGQTVTPRFQETLHASK